METILEAKAYLKNQTEQGKGYKCPACAQFVQVYKRKINANAARSLILMFNESAKYEEDYHKPWKWIHIQKMFAEKGLRATAMDYIQLSRFRLIEKSKEPAKDGKKDNGIWRLTPEGAGFALNRNTIPAYALVYNNKTIGWANAKVKITECLKEKFKYDEIINRNFLQYKTNEASA